ncbi:hypothetical protein K1719_032906 [Acacia pycnantha]|nr:hypothetical protein K1719_032906 [Acacia pycnantha]
MISISVSVELDLTKPLVPEFDVEGQVLSVVYESLGTLCKRCGRVGHTKEGCESATKKRMEGEMEVEGVEAKKKDGAGSPEAKDLWKTVQRPYRQRRYINPVPKQNLGSRFTVLNESIWGRGGNGRGAERVGRNS